MVLAVTAHFCFSDVRVANLAKFLRQQQMPDGGWNCQTFHGAEHGSMHTTILALEALREYERAGGRGTTAAQKRGREFLLHHRLFRSHRTGRVIEPVWTRFSFPPWWHYDILRALDYFQSVRAPRDGRLEEAIEIVKNRRLPSGRWRLQNHWPGAIHFAMERPGQPSRWNTLRARRVLRWWNGGDT